jgi:hypothetical protein
MSAAAMISTLTYSLVVAGAALGAAFLASSGDAFMNSDAAIQLLSTLLTLF